MKLEDGNDGDNDQEKKANERGEHCGGSMVAKGVEFVTNFVPPCMWVTFPP